MKTSQKIILGISKAVLVISLVVFVSSFIVYRVIGQPEQTKQLLNDSGLYATVSKQVRKQFLEGNQAVPQTSAPLVQDAIDKSFNDATVQGIAEDSVDNIYAWLEGKTDDLELTTDMTAIKTTFADNLTKNIEARVASLPPCSRNLTPTTTDITAIECIPRGYNTTAEIEKIRQQILSADTNNLMGQAENTTPGTESFSIIGKQTKQDGQESLNQKFASVKSFYTWAQRLPIISGVLLIISAAIIVAFSTPRYRALKTAGLVSTPMGLLYLLFGLVSQEVIKGMFGIIEKQVGTNEFQPPAQYISQQFADIVSGYLFLFGIVLLLTGIASLIAYKIIQKRDGVTTANTPINASPPQPKTDKTGPSDT